VWVCAMNSSAMARRVYDSQGHDIGMVHPTADGRWCGHDASGREHIANTRIAAERLVRGER
jgi:hypothetical protein